MFTEKKKTHLRGSVTVFLALSFVCIVTLILTLVESARISSAGFILQNGLYSAENSLFSEYSTELWDDYRILAVLCSDKADAEEKLEEYLKTYLSGENWQRGSGADVRIKEMDFLTSSGGEWLEAEIVDYMEFGIVNSLFDTEDKASGLWRDLKESETLQSITEAYAEETVKAADLEDVVGRIKENLDEQKKQKEMALDDLSAHDGDGFENRGEKLEELIRELPNLVCEYETKADELKNDLDEASKNRAAEMENLTEESKNIVTGADSSYDEYIASDGERRKEIEDLWEGNGRSLDIIESCISLVREIQELYEEMEEGEDYEEDLEELWEELYDYFSGLEIKDLNVEFGMEDRERENTIEKAASVLGGDILELVIPQGRTVSDGVITGDDLPSLSILHGRKGDPGSITENILINEYIGKYFSEFTDRKEDALEYEVEYICGGKESDRENLKKALGDVFMIREGMNYLHIMKDPSKRSMADEMALSIVGGTGLPLLAPLLSCLIIGVWAGLESIVDIKALLSGNKVSLMKSESEWKTGIQSIFSLGDEGIAPDISSGDEKGLDYMEYLKFVILLLEPEKRNYRIMDVIQHNIRKKKDSFRMSHCVYGIASEAEGHYSGIFAAGDFSLRTNAFRAY